MSRVLVFLADGFEEIEGLTPVDVLRRAGVEVTTVSIMGRREIHGSHGITVLADALLEEIQLAQSELFLLPGGLKGTENLEGCAPLLEELKKAGEQGKRIAAICAAPRVLAALGLLNGKNATIYPGMEDSLTGANPMKEPVVTDGLITTGRGMGAAVPFALELVSLLCGQEKAGEISRAIVYTEA